MVEGAIASSAWQRTQCGRARRSQSKRLGFDPDHPAGKALLRGNLPTIKKRKQVFLQHFPGGLELAIATAVKQMTVAPQNRNCRHTFLKRNS